MDPSRFRGGLGWQSLVYSIWEQFAGLAFTVGLLIWFRRRFNSQSPLAKAASDSAYAAYVIHGPVIILVAVLLRGIRLYPLAKFALVVLVAVPLTFTLANLVRRLPGAKHVL